MLPVGPRDEERGTSVPSPNYDRPQPFRFTRGVRILGLSGGLLPSDVRLHTSVSLMSFCLCIGWLRRDGRRGIAEGEILLLF